MRSKPLIATAPSVKTDELITELHLWAVHEGLRRTPTGSMFEDFCRRLVAAGVPLWRAFAGLQPYIRNGRVTLTLGGAIVTRSTEPGANAATSMSGIYETAPMPICVMSPRGETCRCAYGVD